jgi:hypothetical protein
MRKLIIASAMPPSGKTKEASGVAHTMAEAATVMSKVSPNAIHQTLKPRRWRPSAFQPSLEWPSLVTTSSMINAATVGVHDHKTQVPNSGVSSRILINKATPVAMNSTRTE